MTPPKRLLSVDIDMLPRQFQDRLDPTFERLERDRVVERLWRKEHHLWKPDPKEITDRLGWLALPSVMRRQQPLLDEGVAAAKAAGIKDVVLLGMGGSSLGPEVLRASFGSAKGFPRLWVLDSTVSAWVRRVTRAVNPSTTLFLVASKSGGTIEVLSLFAHFWNLMRRRTQAPGEHFVAITDPGTGLEEMANEYGFRQTFTNPPDIGGRYSVLSLFGLVPASLLGMDVGRLLERADAMADRCRTPAPMENPGAYLGAAMGTFVKAGRDKVTVIASPAISTFGLWAEQLLAESTGKEGTGVIPVAQEPVLQSSAYGRDRFFVYLRLKSDADAGLDRQVQTLANDDHPVLTLHLQDRYDLGAEFFRWEFATAIAGHILKIHPFDQPNVQESKDNTNRVLSGFQSAGRLPKQPSSDVREAARQLAGRQRTGTYVAILAYTNPSSRLEAALSRLRSTLMSRFRVATTCGYGPRYLHSTGQLHKGGPATGIFLELVDRMKPDLAIPGKPFSFGILAQAQAAGDLESLRAHGRHAVRLELGHDPAATVKALATALASLQPSRQSPQPRKRRKPVRR